MSAALPLPQYVPHIRRMRPLLLATALALVAGPAFAACVAAPDDGSTHYIQNEMALTLCRQAAVSDTMRLRQQQIDLQAALQAQQLNFTMQLQMRQLQADTIDMSMVPKF